MVLDDVELREARGLPGLLDDEVREAPSHEIRVLGGPGAAQEPRKARGDTRGQGVPDSGCGEEGLLLTGPSARLVAFWRRSPVSWGDSVIFSRKLKWWLGLAKVNRFLQVQTECKAHVAAFLEIVPYSLNLGESGGRTTEKR